MRVLGVDPGLSGALAFLGDGETVVLKMPVVAGEVDGKLARHLILRHGPVERAFVEKVRSRPGDKRFGVKSFWKFAHSAGLIRGVLAGMDIPTKEVQPLAWKKGVFGPESPRDKEAAIAYIREAYPHVSILPTPRSRRPDHNMAEALCIAEFGMKQMRRVNTAI